MKINIKNTLTSRQFKKILSNKDTINLLNKEDTKRQYNKLYFAETSRKDRVKQDKLNKRSILMTFILLFGLIMLIGSNILSSNALDSKIDTITAKTMTGTLKSNLNAFGYNQAVTIYGPQLEEMKVRGYSNTRILDLLAIKSMECNSYTSCYGINGNDIGPFQINKIHKEQYNKSLQLHNTKDYGNLYLYQLTYANKLIQSYEDRFCGEVIFKQIGMKYSNEKRFKCVAVSYNGHPKHKYMYKKLGWLKRQMISKFLFENGYLINK